MTLIDAGSLIAGRYQLEARLDAGGRAQVWRATDQELGRPVAVKILLTPAGGDPSFLDAFRAEAQLEARMHHPGVVEVYDWGHDGDANYVVTELLEGLTLRQLLERGPMPPDRAVAFGRQASAALAYAHAEGVAHGSVGPDHVMISPEGHVTFIDFGLQCRGTCEYTALPDADTYALGMLLYEALTGVSPSAPRPVNVPQQDMWPPHPRKLNSSVSPELDRIIMKAIALSAVDRYRKASELQAALDDLARPKSRAGLWALVAGGVLLLAIGGVWLLTAGSNVVVPDLTGMSSTQAESALSSAGLKLVLVGRTASPSLAADTVVAENPASGARVRRGTQVGVTLSTGKPTATVPSVAGTSLQSASSVLAGAGLVVGTVTTQDSSAFPTDTIISQNPSAGSRLAAGRPVNLVISAGRAQVTMPDVRGMAEADATAKLEDLGFTVDAGTAFSTQPVGVVVTQGPAAGSAVTKGNTVTISVSKGPSPVTVPDVTGALAADAKTSLQNVGLVPVSVLTSGTAAQVGKVITQVPARGAKVAPGSQVEIDIGR